MAPTVAFALVLGLALTRTATTSAAVVAHIVVLMMAATNILGSSLIDGDWDRTRGILRSNGLDLTADETETARLWAHPDRRARLEREVAQRPTTNLRWLLALCYLTDDDHGDALTILTTLVDDPTTATDWRATIQAITALTLLATSAGPNPRADLLAKAASDQAPGELYAACACALAQSRHGDPQGVDRLFGELPLRTVKRALHPTWTAALLDQRDTSRRATT